MHGYVSPSFTLHTGSSACYCLILVFAPYQSPRLHYVLSELLERRMGLAFKVVTTTDEFHSSAAAIKINYSTQAIEGALQVIPQGLLFETGTRDLSVDVTRDERWNILLWKNNNKDIPFDVFAASFFLLSRYEEYTNPVRDVHGRFEAKHSLAFQHHFLQTPVIEVWVDQLKKQFLEMNSMLKFSKHEFVKLSTIDIDFAFKYKGTGLKRWAGKLAKSLVHVRLGDVLEQLLVTARLKRDPYDTFELIRKTTDSDLAYFMLMGRKGEYDKATGFNTLTSVAAMLKAQASFIGIHPSYRSNSEHDLLNEEIEALKRLTGTPVRHSRNHFLKLSLPQTYQRLAKAGISSDYTMMYADAVGFRAGTCFPFSFYDLSEENLTQLIVYSGCAMDVTLKDYLCLSPAEAIRMLSDMEAVARKYQGLFITLWHNSSFADEAGWKGWDKVYSGIFHTKR